MSFRRRLTLFFLLIVIVPMIAVGVVVFRLVADNETGKADSRLAEGQQTARYLYTESVNNATRALRRVDSDAALAAAVRARNSKAANRRASAPIDSGAPMRIAVLGDAGSTSSSVASARVVVGLVLIGFLLLAFALALAVSRALHGQVAGLLEGAQRLGGGDFSTPVPTEGSDEFAAL